MTSLNRFAPVLALLVLTVAAGSPAQALSSRTWVSGNGSDANPCSYTAPCKTFAGAIINTAAGGEIDALSPGGYGTVTINKDLTIDGGEGQVSSILAAGGVNGITIATAGVTVTIKNLSINATMSSTAGIYFTNGAKLNVIHCDIFNTQAYGIGFFPASGGAQLNVIDTTIHNSAAYGIASAPTVLMAPARVMLQNVSLVQNGIGLLGMDGSRISASHSNFSDNSSTGVTASSASDTALIDLIDSTVANNGGDGVSASGAGTARIRISGVALYGNVNNAIGGTVSLTTSFGNNAIVDNGVNTVPTSTTPLL